MSARLFVCLRSAEGPLWCHDSTQWGTIECTGPLPPRHTVCVPFSYANESCRRQTLPSPIAPSLPCSPSKTSPDLSLCPNFSEPERPLNSEAEQLCETFALRVMGIRTQQASWGTLVLHVWEKKPSPPCHSSTDGFIKMSQGTRNELALFVRPNF